MVIECTKLCILSSLRQGYGCLWHYKLQHIMISLVAALPFCLAGVFGLLDPVFAVTTITKDMPDGFNFSFAILVLTTFIWAVPVVILWHRLFLLGPEHLIRKRIWPLITRSLTIISHSLILFGIGLVASVAMTWGILYLRVISDSEGMAGTITEMGKSEYILYFVGCFIVFSFLLIIALRLSMAFSAQAIGKSMGFTTSWRMTRKNTFRMLVTTLMGLIPFVVINGILLWAAKYYYQIDLWAGTAPDQNMVYLFVLLFSPFLAMPVAILCSLTSTYYRHCGCADYKKT